MKGSLLKVKFIIRLNRTNCTKLKLKSHQGFPLGLTQAGLSLSTLSLCYTALLSRSRQEEDWAICSVGSYDGNPFDLCFVNAVRNCLANPWRGEWL